MSIIVEKLKAEQFQELYQFSDGFVPDPKISWAFVARRNGKIVGRVFILNPAHVEGPYIEPDERSGLIGAQMMEKLQAEALGIGITKLFAYATNAKIESYLGRLGFKKSPMTVWEKEI